MDLNMPVLDGFEATRRIREAVPSATVIAVSGSASESDARRALAAGAAGFLSKAELGGELTDYLLELAV
jgi:CheY-like chemotaxis protein